MRTIKFRGKRIDNGEWVYGDLEIRRNTGVCLIHTYNDDDTYKKQFEVVTDSVGQFTGFYDNNGKEIYEGDIIRSWYDDIDYVQKGIVEWKNGCFVYSDDIANWPASTLFVGTIHCEVIGNIHDNPNFLEGDTK